MAEPTAHPNSRRGRSSVSSEELTKQVAYSVKMEQQLIDARYALDRDMQRLMSIHTYSQRAIDAPTVESFMSMTAEAIIEAFDLECSAVLSMHPNRRQLSFAAEFGLGRRAAFRKHLPLAWVVDRSLDRVGHAAIERVHGQSGLWWELGLAEIVLFPYANADSTFDGILVGGVSCGKQAFFGTMGDDLLPSFVVFGQQMQSLFHNLSSRQIIREQLRTLEENTERIEAAQRELASTNADLNHRVSELATLHRVGAKVASILDVDRLAESVLDTIVEDFGYERAALFQIDHEHGVVGGGKLRSGLGTATQSLVHGAFPIDGFVENPSSRPEVLQTERFDDVRFTTCVTDPALCATLGSKRALVVPLRSGSRLVGLLTIGEAARGDPMNDGDRMLLATFAHHVATALHNARLVEKAARSERMSAIGEMAAGIAHEIRNPLTSIGTLLDIIERETHGVDPVLFEGIKQESQRLQSLTTRFLDYARPYDPKRQPEDINLLLEEVTSILGADPAFSSVRIEKHCDKRLPDVCADGDSLKQVFWNLILNGLQSMEGGGLLMITSLHDRTHIKVRIADSGAGIDPADRKRIFQPFFTKRDGGSGLGLSIADKIISAHGGSLALESNVGVGTTVTVSFPREAIVEGTTT
jgi:signal transduction histidine kinase